MQRLDLISKLISLKLLKEKKTISQKIDLLLMCGFSNREIADLLGKTPAYVRAVKSQLKEKKSKKNGDSGEEKGK